MSYEVFRFKGDTKWSVRKKFAKIRLTQETFDTIELAEQWIRDQYVPQYKYDRPWIDHEIDGSRGHLMTLEDWKRCCDQGGFIDYDGNGDLMTAEYQLLHSTRPSDYTHKKRQYPVEAKYILWYNR